MNDVEKFIYDMKMHNKGAFYHGLENVFWKVIVITSPLF